MPQNRKRPVYINIAGHHLLGTSILNKGSAFSVEERRTFNLEGLIPTAVETIDEQVTRAYQQYSKFDDAMNKHIYLRHIQDTNETLYLRLVSEYIEEMLPVIYTPTVGEACQLFSQIYRNKRGVFLTYEDRDYVEDVLRNATKPNVKVVVITDSERILGLGDQGIGGMGIPIGKLALYSACGGISPAYTMPITLDTGTDNEDLLNDPMYMGKRHRRVRGKEYDDFVDHCLQQIARRWPDAIIQFEDFAQVNATPLLARYRHQLRCFNDDIQGTACVTVGTLLAACRAMGQGLKGQRVVFAGAGSAGCGIAEQIVMHMVDEGMDQSAAYDAIYLTNSTGLVHTESDRLKDFQASFAKSPDAIAHWHNAADYSLENVVKEVKPTIIIGVSGQPNIFTQEMVEYMLTYTDTPIVLPLSNPTSKCEALPEDVITWSKGKAIVATGSPFDDVAYDGNTYAIAQCNNAYIFPGLGLGVIAVKASQINDAMFMAASEALASCSPRIQDSNAKLLPSISAIHEVSKTIAIAVAKQAIADGLAAPVSEGRIAELVERNFWLPEYRDYKRTTI